MSSLEAAVFVAKRLSYSQAEVVEHYSGFIGRIGLAFRYIMGREGYRDRQQRDVGAPASPHKVMRRYKT
jgi:hypothetical protein